MNAQKIIEQSEITAEQFDEIDFVYRAIEAKYLKEMHQFEEQFDKVCKLDDMPVWMNKSYFEYQLKWRIACRLHYRGGAGAGGDWEIENTYHTLESLKARA